MFTEWQQGPTTVLPPKPEVEQSDILVRLMDELERSEKPAEPARPPAPRSIAAPRPYSHD